jgi:chromosome segregation ATPase
MSATRLSIAGFFILLIITLFFAFKFTDNVNSLSEQVLTADSRIKVIATDLGSIKQNLVKLNTSISTPDSQPYQEITASVEELQTSVETVRNKMKELTTNISQMRQQISELATQDDTQRPRSYR